MRTHAFPNLVDQVADRLDDSVQSKRTIGEVADELGEHSSRICDAIETVYMLGWDNPAIRHLGET
jgi:hypothetical protein